MDGMTEQYDDVTKDLMMTQGDDVTDITWIQEYSNGNHGNMTGKWLITFAFCWRIFVLVLGSIGNGLSILFVRSTKLKITTRLIITLLALVDSSFLILEGSNEIYYHAHGRYLYDKNTSLCKLFTFNYYFTNALSYNLVAVLTVERCIAVTIPLKAKVIWTFRSVAIILILLCSILLGWCSFVIYYFNNTDYFDGQGEYPLYVCHPPDHIYDLILTVNPYHEALLPVSTVVICSMAIVLTLMRKKCTKAFPFQNNQMNKNERELILITVALSVAFLILCVPQALYYNFGEKIFGREIFYNPESVPAVVVEILNYTNFGINFYLYVAFTRSFREQLQKIVSSCRMLAGADLSDQSATPTIEVSNVSGV